MKRRRRQQLERREKDCEREPAHHEEARGEETIGRHQRCLAIVSDCGCPVGRSTRFLFRFQRRHRIDPRRAPGRDHAREQRRPASARSRRRRTSADPPVSRSCSSDCIECGGDERHDEADRRGRPARASGRCRGSAAARRRGRRRWRRGCRSRACAGSPGTTARRRCRSPTVPAPASRTTPAGIP